MIKKAISFLGIISHILNSSPVSVPDGGTGVSSVTAYTILCGGTTSIEPLQSVASVGTANQALTSNGAGALPTFQTYAADTLRCTSTTISSASIKTLRATPVELIPAPSAGNIILVRSIIAKFNYGGTNVFTNGQILRVGYTNSSGIVILSTCVPSAMITASSNRVNGQLPAASTGTAYTNLSGLNVVIYNSGASEITGNAAGDNTLTINVYYYVVTI